MSGKDSSLCCLKCGYELNGLRQCICPECGTVFDADSLTLQRDLLRRLWKRSYLPGVILLAYSLAVPALAFLDPQAAYLLGLPFVLLAFPLAMAGGTSSSLLPLLFVGALAIITLNALYVHRGIRHAESWIVISDDALLKMRVTAVVTSALGGIAVMTISWLMSSVIGSC